MKRYHPNDRPGYREKARPYIEVNRAKSGNTGELKCHCGKVALYRFITRGACKEHKADVENLVKRHHADAVRMYGQLGIEETANQKVYDTLQLDRLNLKATRRGRK